MPGVKETLSKEVSSSFLNRKNRHLRVGSIDILGDKPYQNNIPTEPSKLNSKDYDVIQRRRGIVGNKYVYQDVVRTERAKGEERTLAMKSIMVSDQRKMIYLYMDLIFLR